MENLIWYDHHASGNTYVNMGFTLIASGRALGCLTIRPLCLPSFWVTFEELLYFCFIFCIASIYSNLISIYSITGVLSFWYWYESLTLIPACLFFAYFWYYWRVIPLVSFLYFVIYIWNCWLSLFLLLLLSIVCFTFEWHWVYSLVPLLLGSVLVEE